MMLFVGNLPAGTSDAELEESFSPHGVVTSARIPTSTFSDRSRGFGVVEMLRESGELAISELNGQQIDGMVLRVNEANGETKKKRRHSGSITFPVSDRSAAVHRDSCRLSLASRSDAEFAAKITQPGNTRLPSIHVSVTRMSEIAVGSTARGSLSRTTKSASLPGSRLPISCSE